MKLLTGIRALFTYKKEAKQIGVHKAVITPGRVILKPVGTNKTVSLKASDVDIIINNLNELDANDIKVTSNSHDTHENESRKKAKENIKSSFDNDLSDDNELDAMVKPLNTYIAKKKNISLSLYPDEFEMISEIITSNGYKRTEFILACITAAKKQSMVSEYNRYTKEHKQRRMEAREAALLAQEQIKDNKILES